MCMTFHSYSFVRWIYWLIFCSLFYSWIDHYIECIYDGLIEFAGVDFRHIVKGVPRGATFTILSDSCHSGGLIDKEKEQIGPCDHPTCGNETPEPPPNTQSKSVPFEFLLRHLSSITKLTTRDIAPHHLELFGDHASLSFKQADKRPEPLDADEGILLSGCQANEVSRDVPTKEGQPPRGAFSYAVETVLKEHPGPLSNRELVLLARKVIKKYQLPQHPCLYCCDGNADAVFLRQSWSDHRPT